MSDAPGTDVDAPRDAGAALARLAEVTATLRVECPWDAEQTHRSLVPHLVEETAEAVDAIEQGNATDLREELGDVLVQVYFHAQIAAERGDFDLTAVADGIADKLIERHPHVFSGEEVPEDMSAAWEQRKNKAKGRTSALDGIADALDPLARAGKVVSRTRNHGVPVELDERPIGADEFGQQMLSLVARAQASGVDPAQATRDAVRSLEQRVHDTEASPR